MGLHRKHISNFPKVEEEETSRSVGRTLGQGNDVGMN